MLPDRIRQLKVRIGPLEGGTLTHGSEYVFTYPGEDRLGPAVGLLMPRREPVYQNTALFPVMDQNLPEGYLFQRIRDAHPKQALTPMHLLAVVGANGIGRLGFELPDQPIQPTPTPISRQTILNASGPAIFDQLIHAYLNTGAGVAGVQPKIMVPERSTVPIPNLIVKAGASAYPNLAINEFVCMSAARRAGIRVPTFDLSHDGTLLVLDRFDLVDQGGHISRLGFEDVAALFGRQVRDVLSERKDHGSYELIAELFKRVDLPHADLIEFYAQVAFSVMVRNGDAHLKNFGLLYTSDADARLAPMFDVVTTSLYRYARFDGGPPLEDNTLALRMFRGKNHRTRRYPTKAELLRFGASVCHVAKPADVVQEHAQAMTETLQAMRADDRVPAAFLARMGEAWQPGLAHAR